MTRLIITLAVVFVFGLASARGETVIKLGTFAPVGSTYHDILLDLDQDWARISDGSVRLKIFAGGVTGDESDMVRKMRIGQLHAATLTSGGLPDIDPDFRAFQIPMMFRSIDEFDHVLKAHRSTLDGLLDRNGFRAIGWADAGWLHFFSRKPIAVPDDLRPQPLFVWSGADRFVKAWSDGGFLPRQLPATDIHTALQSRMIEVISAPPLIALSNQWFAQVPHMTTLKWVPLIGCLVITERAWKTLPRKLRPELTDAADRAARKMRAEVRRNGDQAIEIMTDYGLIVHEATPAEFDIWRAEVKAFFGPMIGSYIDRRLVDQIEVTLNDYRERN